MFEIRKTDTFAEWQANLKDRTVAAKVVVRLERAEAGNLGDHKSVGNGVSEMRIKHGPGFRLYFTRQGNEIIILLCGGDKSSQDKDIERAKKMVQEL